MATIVPRPGVLLIKMIMGDIRGIEKSHDTSTSGILIAQHGDDQPIAPIGATVYYRAFKDDARVGKDMALVEIKDILGVSYDTTTTAGN